MAGEGLRVSSTNGKAYGEYVIPDPPETDEMFQVPVRTGSVAIVAHPTNTGYIYIGWDSDVTTDNGFLMTPGQSITMDLDAMEQEIFITGDSEGDSVRYIAKN